MSFELHQHEAMGCALWPGLGLARAWRPECGRVPEGQAESAPRLKPRCDFIAHKSLHSLLSVVKTQTVTALKQSKRAQPKCQYGSLEGWFGSWCLF